MPDTFSAFECMGEQDMKLLKTCGTIFLLSVFISACTLPTRVSSWDSPRGFTKTEVLNAVILAGAQSGMHVAHSDQEKGIITFHARITGHFGTRGKGGITQHVQVRDNQGVVNVQTTNDLRKSFGDYPLSPRLFFEKFIGRFHKLLFKNLNILDPSATKYRIEE